MTTSESRNEMETLGVAYIRAKAKYEALQKELVEKIPGWIDDDVKQVEVVRGTGLTREYIRQIVEKAKKARGGS